MNEDYCTPYRFHVFSDATLMDCIRTFGDREYPVRFVPYTPYDAGYFMHSMAEEKCIYSYAAAKYQHLILV